MTGASGVVKTGRLLFWWLSIEKKTPMDISFSYRGSLPAFFHEICGFLCGQGEILCYFFKSSFF